MRRITVFAALICMVTVLLVGCSDWMSSEYLWIQPHKEQGVDSGERIIGVSSYSQLQSELERVVSDGAEEIVFSVSDFSDSTVDFYVNTAVNHILDSTAIGAYAVNKISYEIGTNRGQPVVAFRVEYKRSVKDIRNIKKISNSEEMLEAIKHALDACEQSVILHTTQYEELELTKFISGYASENPDKVMEIPYVNLVTYPATGQERVVEITLIYLTYKDTLLEMQRQVQAVFTSAELYVKGTGQVIDIYSRLYSFLMERSKYTQNPSITPAYSLLQDATGDSVAFANVYAAMCRKSGLECNTVSGLRNGESWSWNILRYRGRYYHVDLLQCSENGDFVLIDGKDMMGYDWDIKQYPIN